MSAATSTTDVIELDEKDGLLRPGIMVEVEIAIARD